MFCANDQMVTPHVGMVDGNGEFVFTCACGRFVKFPSDITPVDFKDLVEKHEDHNVGQVDIAVQEAKLEALLNPQPEDPGTEQVA